MTTLWIAGDSTAADGEDEYYPRKGWGQVLGRYFGTNLDIENHATSGESSKSFMDGHDGFHDGYWEDIETQLQPGDFVIIQFGHNDNKPEDWRATDPWTTYQDYLTLYVNETIAKGATPILASPVERDYWTGSEITDTHDDYPEAMAALASELDCDFVDLTTLSKAHFEDIGESKTPNIFMVLPAGVWPNYPAGSTDHTHFQENGAYVIAGMFLDNVISQGLALANYLNTGAASITSTGPMKELLYEDDSHELFLHYPSMWDAATITGVTVGIKDKANNTLLAATAATLTTAVINGAVTAKGMSVVVDGLSGELRRGARLRLEEKTAADVEENETVTIRSVSVSGSDYTVELEDELKHDHSDDTDVTGCYAYYDADLSDTDTFTKGLEVVVTWTPIGANNDDHAWTEIYRISGAKAGVPGLWDDLRVSARSVWELIENDGSEDLEKLRRLIQDSFEDEFTEKQLDINRVKDQRRLHKGFLLHAQEYILRPRGEQYKEALKEIQKAWAKWFSGLINDPLWVDTDQDEIEDDEEVDTHGFEIMELNF